MAVFATHVVLMRDFQAVAFAPGDALPEWAEDLVGAHCLETEADSEVASEDDGAEGTEEPDTDADDVETEGPTPAPADAPDFTAPAPRRNSRSRK